MKAYFLDGPLATGSSTMTPMEEKTMTIMCSMSWGGEKPHPVQYFPAFEGTLAGVAVAVMTTRTDIGERDLIALIEEAMAIQLTHPDEQAMADRTSLQLDAGVLDTLSMKYLVSMARINKRLLEIQYESRNRNQPGRIVRHPNGLSGIPD